jgi:hypothetical protein
VGKVVAVVFYDFMKVVRHFKLKTFGSDATNVEQLRIWLRPLGSPVERTSPPVGDDTLISISLRMIVKNLRA